MVIRRGSLAISRPRITRKINSHIGAIILLQEVGDGGEEQMEPRSKKSEAAAEAAMLPASCHQFSTPRIKHDRGGPRGGQYSFLSRTFHFSLSHHEPMTVYPTTNALHFYTPL